MNLSTLLQEPTLLGTAPDLLPAPGEVRVAWVDLTREPTPALLERLRAWLTVEEQSRSDRFRFDPDRQAFVIGRSLIRGGLARLLGKAPSEVPLLMGAHGRPELAEGHLPWAPSFNVSHTQGILGFALSRTTVGLDVEAFRRDPDPLMVGGQVFSARELQALQALPPELQREQFRRLWALKEAYLKARGTGLSLPAREITCHLQPGHPPQLSFTEAAQDLPGRWHCVELRPTDRAWAAVCVETAAGKVVEVRETWVRLPPE